MYIEKIIELGLDKPDAWHQDIRDKLIELYSMLTNDTDYYLEKNYGDTTKEILELRKNGESKRIMGFEKKVRNMELGWFVDKNYYNKASAVIELPMKNCKKATENAGNQLYPKNISLEKMWNVICIITGKRDQMLQI